MSEAGYLLDTNVVSEIRRKQAHRHVRAFVDGLEDDKMFVSALTIGELRRGAELKRRSDAVLSGRLFEWIDEVEAAFFDRVLPVDAKAAHIWGALSVQRSRPVIDTLIAATALAHKMTLVTRNVADVKDTGVALINPWAPIPEHE
ncbi:type II toxin-antitoxin system VapC family toxin [Kaistia sp. UC242_56]|uniref:type II toxin-antitoxin system VapC family toxin n=1 Tax=Kaistia sp. UC242_56 TaxID=3374625 RepID=UPI0037974C73